MIGKHDLLATKDRFTFVSFVSFVVCCVSAIMLCAWPTMAQAPAAPATERPVVGPARPFQLAPRVERTLANGLHIIVTQQSVVPKVSVTLTIKSGY